MQLSTHSELLIHSLELVKVLAYTWLQNSRTETIVDAQSKVQPMSSKQDAFR